MASATTTSSLVILRLPQVIERTTLKKSAIYQKIKDHKFPAPAKLGGVSAWAEHEIDAWLEQQFTERRGSRPTDASS